ncbi:hypothetical protein ACIQWV_36445 [Streptomyces sp. NPDC098085]|uniref:hypothetical protein n=1 Tax=unclassified Streptomyces TaxID=2593676 RepID=UPI003817418B
MKRKDAIVHRSAVATALAAVVGAMSLITAPTATAAPTGPARPSCLTNSQEEEWGRGEIKICVENGNARVTGYVEDLLPGSGWGEPDGQCVAWYIYWETPSGAWEDYSPGVCGHWAKSPYLKLDYDPTELPEKPPEITGATKAVLVPVQF